MLFTLGCSPWEIHIGRSGRNVLVPAGNGSGAIFFKAQLLLQHTHLHSFTWAHGLPEYLHLTLCHLHFRIECIHTLGCIQWPSQDGINHSRSGNTFWVPPASSPSLSYLSITDNKLWMTLNFKGCSWIWLLQNLVTLQYINLEAISQGSLPLLSHRSCPSTCYCNHVPSA